MASFLKLRRRRRVSDAQREHLRQIGATHRFEKGHSHGVKGQSTGLESTQGRLAASLPAGAICDELAFFKSSEGYPTDTEMLRALRPCLATTGGKLIILSHPYAAAGALHDLHRRHFGRDDSETLIWVASAPEMNPTLPADYLKRMQADDPEAYRSKVLGEFRAGIATLFDPESIMEFDTSHRNLIARGCTSNSLAL